jgi:uncharacterized membrane protein YjfL (UPF0719 family)
MKKITSWLTIISFSLLLSGCQLFTKTNPENMTIEDVLSWIAELTRLALMLAFGVTLIYLILGGYQYMTSLGNEEQIKKGKTTLTWAIIGLIVIMVSYSLIRLLLSILLQPAEFKQIFPYI